MEIYYAIMNILDYMALHEVSAETENKLFQVLDTLRESDIDFSDESKTDYISSLADANDCGADCTSWEMVVSRLRELFEKGERIHNG